MMKIKIILEKTSTFDIKHKMNFQLFSTRRCTWKQSKKRSCDASLEMKRFLQSCDTCRAENSAWTANTPWTSSSWTSLEIQPIRACLCFLWMKTRLRRCTAVCVWVCGSVGGAWSVCTWVSVHTHVHVSRVWVCVRFQPDQIKHTHTHKSHWFILTHTLKTKSVFSSEKREKVAEMIVNKFSSFKVSNHLCRL